MQIANIAEICACIISAFYYNKIKNSFLKWLPLYLLYVSAFDFFIHYTVPSPRINALIYFSITMLSIIFYNNCFYKLFQHIKKIQNLIIILSSLLFLAGFLLFFSAETFQRNSYYLLIVVGIEVSAIACIYLYNLFLSDDLQVLLIKQSGFWMSAGVLLFFSGICFTFAISPIAIKYNLKIFDTYLVWFIPRTLSVILYSSLTVAVVLYKPKPKNNIEHGR